MYMYIYIHTLCFIYVLRIGPVLSAMTWRSPWRTRLEHPARSTTWRPCNPDGRRHPDGRRPPLHPVEKGPQYTGMHRPCAGVLVGMHPRVPGYPSIYGCMPIWWGTPVNGNAFPYVGIPIHVGMSSHIQRNLIIWGCLPMYLSTHGNASPCTGMPQYMDMHSHMLGYSNIWELMVICCDIPTCKDAFPYTRVPQFMGMHPHLLEYTWACIPVCTGYPISNMLGYPNILEIPSQPNPTHANTTYIPPPPIRMHVFQVAPPLCHRTYLKYSGGIIFSRAKLPLPKSEHVEPGPKAGDWKSGQPHKADQLMEMPALCG